MPGTGKALATMVRLGMRYGPVAYEAVKHGKDPARAIAGRTFAKANARRQGLLHAASVVDGSTMRVFRGDAQIWVVFSGNTPIGTHPHVDVPMEQLLAHADLTQRIRPGEQQRRRLKRLRSRHRHLESR
ncbi:MAG TPA: hypothetical protein VFL99_12310 [Segeticoccus sp.]|uniref:hypothetical protein n=1 Tax=Segeticoccus sp. TaxID=2706531 RepID=UPI002D7FD0B8|nr:hypothetical protein [Segeticoccus sp.]HET8601103.1 hypothetical protein [Segeticoccus sp.]